MNRIFLASMIGAASFALLAPALAQPRQAQQCLRINQVDSFSPIRGERRAVVVIDKFRNKFKLSLNGACEDLDYTGSVAIRSHANFGLSCVGTGDIVITRSVAGWRDRCAVTRVEQYTPDMERADIRGRERRD